MIDYDETIADLQEWLPQELEVTPEGAKILNNAITLLQQYREGLEGIAKTKANIDGSGKSFTELFRVTRLARKTLEGPK